MKAQTLNMKNCALCEKESNLQKSHIIPKFVTDWIKKTSATGYLRAAIKPNLRVQDGVKKELLCKECELKFSKYENYFADAIFYPYMNKNRTSFEYNENLMKFIISLSWRIIKIDLLKFKEFQPEMYDYAKKAESYWRNILLNDDIDDQYEHHFFLFDYVVRSSKELPDKFQTYIMRDLDSTLVSSKKEVYLFSKFPSLLFISSIYPKKLSGWENTIISKKGIIGNQPQICKQPDFGDFLFSRVMYLEKNPISPEQNDKITQTMLNDVEKVRKSKSLEVWLAEKKRIMNAGEGI